MPASAQARGGIAATTAAFLERACALTGDPARQAARARAARAKFAAGDPVAAESLLAMAEAGSRQELALAEIRHLRAQIAFDLQRGRDAPPLLLNAARRLSRSTPRSRATRIWRRCSPPSTPAGSRARPR